MRSYFSSTSGPTTSALSSSTIRTLASRSWSKISRKGTKMAPRLTLVEKWQVRRNKSWIRNTVRSESRLVFLCARSCSSAYSPLLGTGTMTLEESFSSLRSCSSYFRRSALNSKFSRDVKSSSNWVKSHRCPNQSRSRWWVQSPKRSPKLKLKGK